MPFQLKRIGKTEEALLPKLLAGEQIIYNEGSNAYHIAGAEECQEVFPPALSATRHHAFQTYFVGLHNTQTYNSKQRSGII